MERARAGRRERRKVATRAELVRAGRRLFGGVGIYEARVEDLAEQAGIGKGTLYLYFSSKHELVRAVMEAGFQELGRELDRASAGVATFPELVDAIARVHVEFFAANRDLLHIFHQARGALNFGRPEWLPLGRPLERHVGRIAGQFERVPSPIQHQASQRRTIALILFGSVSGACGLRSAVAGPGSARWSAALRSGLRGMAIELAGHGGRVRWARTRGRMP